MYSESGGQLSDLLDIDPDNGWLFTKGLFSSLQGSVLSFFVKAQDSGTPPRHALVSVYIHVLSGDAHLPVFTQPQFSFSLSEDTPIGFLLGAVLLQDGRGGQHPLQVSFSSVNGQTAQSNADAVFLVEKHSGSIKLDKPLDHERTPVYRFRVTASLQQGFVDAITSADVEVKVLDVNDNRPAFQTHTYEATVSEGLPAGSRILQVQATDPDWSANGQVTYSLAPPGLLGSASDDARNEGGFFSIDSTTGWISTLKGLDHELSSAHNITVWAYDLGEPASQSSSATVIVAVSDINNNVPEFLQPNYYGNVRESDAPGEVVVVLNSQDHDRSPGNRQVTYHITGKSPEY